MFVSSGCIELTFHQHWDVSACHHRIHKNIMPSVLPKFLLSYLWQEDEMHLRVFISLFGQVLFQNLLRIAKSTGGRAWVPHSSWGQQQQDQQFITDSSTSTQVFFLPKPVLAPLLSASRGESNIFSLSILVLDMLATFWSVPIIWGAGHLPVTYPGVPSDVFEEAVVLYPTVINLSRYFSLWFEWFSQSIPAFCSPWKYRL